MDGGALIGGAAGPGPAAPAPRQGEVAPHVAAELPGLGLAWVEAACRPGRSPEPVRARLRELSDRFYGSHAVHMRQRPIPWAYRVFFRHIGLDPDADRTPVERVVLERLHDGALRSTGLPADAVTIAVAETGVAVRPLDADRIEGAPVIRDTAPGEKLAGGSGELPRGTLVIADDRRPVGVLFGSDAPAAEVGRGTRRVALLAIRVKNVPEIAIDEALRIAAATLGS